MKENIRRYLMIIVNMTNQEIILNEEIHNLEAELYSKM